jgi:hypothetical protein
MALYTSFDTFRRSGIGRLRKNEFMLEDNRDYVQWASGLNVHGVRASDNSVPMRNVNDMAYSAGVSSSDASWRVNSNAKPVVTVRTRGKLQIIK